MLLLVAILLAVLVVHGDAGLVLVAAVAIFEIVQSLLWYWYSRRGQARVGPETLLGRVAQVASECRPRGTVRLDGELWRASCASGAAVGDQVRVRRLEGLTLEVEPVAPAPPSAS
jgi:membrane protein implicated in regulation of membrane protease activity